MTVVAEKRRTVILDLLRVFAAFWVVGFHWSMMFGSGPIPDWLSDVLRGGYLGVDIFFMLSGAVIIHSAFERSALKFARSRALRLLPAYFISAVIVASIAVAGGHFNVSSFLSMTGLAVWNRQIDAIGPAWTLPIEIFFYALVFVLIVLSRGKLDPAKFRVGAGALLVLHLLALQSGIPFLVAITGGEFVPEFLLGALLAVSKTNQEFRKSLPTLLLALLQTLWVANARTSEMGVSGTPQLVWICVLVFGTAGVIFVAQVAPNPILPQIANRIIVGLALMTYPIYLLHFNLGATVIRFVYEAGASGAVSMVVGLMAILLVSWAITFQLEPRIRNRVRSYLGW